ncbi:MAG TPA: hypothetical protein GXX47_02810 [Firmicutes bacterium]|nr:hypothetical protein [Bacillota bacterium]
MEKLGIERLEFIGAGKHGEVYKIDEKRCIKIYRKRRYLRLELAALQRGAEAEFFPKVYDWGRDYIVREYVPGIPLNEYLRTHPLTEEVAHQLADMVEIMRRLGFRRADTRLSHIIIDENGKLWLIDPVNTMKKSPPYPRKLLKGLMRRGMAEQFLEYIRKRYPDNYRQWQLHLDTLISRSNKRAATTCRLTANMEGQDRPAPRRNDCAGKEAGAFSLPGYLWSIHECRDKSEKDQLESWTKIINPKNSQEIHAKKQET